jgi:hypothetical protein
MLLPNDAVMTQLEFPNPPRRQPIGGSVGLLEVDPRAPVDAVRLHELQEVGLRLPVRRREPTTFDL